MRFDAGWHPINQPVAVLRDRWLPAFRAEAERAGKTVPPLYPRIRMQITSQPITAPDRVLGTGTLDQIHADFVELQALGAEYVVLDWFNPPDLEGTRAHERAFAMLGLLAEKVIDLEHRAVR